MPEGDGTAIVDVRDVLEALPDPVEAELAELGEHANFVLDTATAIRRAQVGDEPGRRYRETVRTIQADTYDRAGVSYVYFLAPDVEHLTRGEWELIYELDGAFTVTHNTTARDVETYLHVHKLRDVAPQEETFRLELDWQASIDSSENIG